MLDKMRLLFLTNFYPPASRGGYEQWCQEVAEQLRGRGHEILILTSRHRQDEISEAEPDWLRRGLNLEMEIGVSLWNSLRFFTDRRRREAENLQHLRQMVDQFEPDAILVWGMWNLHRSLPALAERLLPGRVVYYIGDYWPTLPSQHQFYWQAPAQSRLSMIPKRLLGAVALRLLAREKQPVLDFAHVLFPTTFMQQELGRKGMRPKRSKVVYGAIDTSLYRFRNGQGGAESPKKPLTLLYLGRLSPEKGVHTAIEALGLLVQRHGLEQLTLQIVGGGEPDYTQHLRQLAAKQNVVDFISFMGPQPKEALPQIYQQADILLFTSIWQEPFGRVPIEAMASGAVVVGTATGGAGEVLSHEHNGLAFPPEDAPALSTQILKLVQSPSLRAKLAKAARQTALEKFDIQQMTTGIESYLQMIVEKQ